MLFSEGAGGLAPAKYLNIFCQKFTPANNPEFGSVFTNIAQLVYVMHCKASYRLDVEYILVDFFPAKIHATRRQKDFAEFALL